MAKRFIDTDLFKKRFIRSLKGPYKLLWVYLFCECNHAGIWEVDLEAAQLYCGHKFNLDEIKKYFVGKIHFFNNDNKAFLPDFIEFQYGEISAHSKNPALKSVILQLSKYQLFEILETRGLKGASKPLDSTFKGTKDMDMDKDMDKDNNFSLLLSFLEKSVNDLPIEKASDSRTFHNAVFEDLKEAGYNCFYEYVIPNGRIDILVSLSNGENVAIELDRKTPRAKNLIKVEGLDCKIISILREPYLGKSYNQFNIDGLILYRGNWEKEPGVHRPTLEEVSAYCNERRNGVDPQQWLDYYEARGWKYKGNLVMKDWKAAVRTWERNGFSKPPEPPKSRIRETFEALEHAKQMLRNEQYANNTD